MFKRFALAMLLGMFVVSLAACNTMEGAGKDIEEGGKAIQEAAD